MNKVRTKKLLLELAQLDIESQIVAISSLKSDARIALFESIPNFLSDDESVYYSLVEDEQSITDDLLLSKVAGSDSRRLSRLIRQALVRRSASAIKAGEIERCIHLLLEAGKIRPLNEGLSQRLSRAIGDRSLKSTKFLGSVTSSYLLFAREQLADESLPPDDRSGIERTAGILEGMNVPPARAMSSVQTPPAPGSLRDFPAYSAGPTTPGEAWADLSDIENRTTEHARKLYKSQLFIECENYCRTLIESGFPFAEIYKLYVLSLGKRHLFSDALDVARRALVEVDDRPANVRQKIACATASGDYRLAIEFIGESFDRGVDSSEFWAAIASFAWQRGDLGLAEAAAAHAHARSPSPEMKRLAARSKAAASLLNRHDGKGISLDGQTVVDRLSNPPEPFVSDAIRRLLKPDPGGHHASVSQPIVDRPRHVAVIGMHLGFGGSPQKALRLASHLAEVPGGPRVSYLCPEARTDRDVTDLGANGLELVVYGSAEPAEVDETTDALLKLCGTRRRTHILALIQTLRRLAVDTVHAIGTMELLLEVAIACALAGIRLCVLNPGMMRPDEYAKKDVSRDESKNYRALLRAVSDDPRFVIANNSQRAAADVAEWLEIATPLVSVLRNGTLLPQQAPASQDQRAALGYSGDEFIISVVGRLAHEKFPELCLEVFASLRDSVRRPVKLLFVGDGPMRQTLETAVQDRGLTGQVGFTGFVDAPGEYYAISDAVLFLTRAEGLPNVVIEAQAHGVPVVASEGGGTAECLKPDETGFLLPTLEPSAIVDRLRRLIESPGTAADMGQRAHQFAAKHYSMHRMAADALGIYSGGKTSALSLWRKDARTFRTAPFGRRDVEKWATVARAQTAIGGIAEARRLMAAALRIVPGSKACWDELIRAEALLARLPRSRSLYAGLVSAWCSAGKINQSTANARLLDLGVTVPPDESEPFSPSRVAEAQRRDRWSILRQVCANGGKAATERLRHAVRVQDAFSAAGLALEDGDEPLVRLLTQDWPLAGENLRAGVIMWIGSLALGGGERQTANLLAELARLNIEVQLLVDQPDETRNRITSMVEPRAISTLEVTPTAHLDPRLVGLLAAIGSSGATAARAQLPKLVTFFARQRPAIVHVRGVAENALVVAAASLLSGTPRTIINIGTMLHSRQSDGRPDTTAQHERNLAVLNAIASSPTATFVFNSDGARDDWRTRVAIPADRARVIYNGFDASAFETALPEHLAPIPGELEQRRKGGTSIVLGVFRFHHVKRPLLWVRAALILLNSGKACHFVIAGDGRLMAEARHLVISHSAQDHFTFLGAVEAGLGELYRRADVLLHTARTESSPNVVMEAQAFGVAVVAPRVGGVEAIVREGETAVLVDRQTAKAYAEAVSVALDPGMRLSAQQAGPALVAAIADPERVSNEFMRVYETQEAFR